MLETCLVIRQTIKLILKEITMKKSLLVLSLALLSFNAFATGPGGNVSGAATSSVSGYVNSNSAVSGVNRSAVHGAYASSQNSTVVTGSSTPNGATTNAYTHGDTFTAAGGIGSGSAHAGAEQAGYGLVNAGTPNVHATSEVGVDTWSAVDNSNTALGISGSEGGAFNHSHVGVGGAHFSNAAVSNAHGSTFGVDGVRTTGIGSGVTAGGTSAQFGSYYGTVTQNIAAGGNGGNGNGGGNGGNDHGDDDHGDRD